MTDRFELEQDIMQCWGIFEDLDLLMSELERVEDARLNDHLSNIVSGLRSVYDMRFNKMWETFEELVKTKQI